LKHRGNPALPTIRRVSFLNPAYGKINRLEYHKYPPYYELALIVSSSLRAIGMNHHTFMSNVKTNWLNCGWTLSQSTQVKKSIDKI